MKPIGRVGVSVLLLLVLATPVMACLIPAIAMTAAERDCCKRMAGECYKGMAQSHSCCQTVTVSHHVAAIKSLPVLNGQHPTMLVACKVHPGLTILRMPDFDSPPMAVDIHSPPVVVSVLRI